MTPEALVYQTANHIHQSLPEGVTSSYFESFLRRKRKILLQIATEHLTKTQAQSSLPAATPDLWTPSQRTAANLKAMHIAARSPKRLSANDRTALSAYSGWGGLSIDKAKSQFPSNFPVPETRGLIHEYYTPTKVAVEIARVIFPLVSTLPHYDSKLHALEPSAGIGRFLQATTHFPNTEWYVIEWSELSARMLNALYPELSIFQGPFERWVRENAADVTGKLGLIIANPPYGARGASITDDPDRSYREKTAYAYFLRRGLDLLAPNGLGAFLVPSGFLTGRSHASVTLREKVLKRHHLASAYRLPSNLFPGAMLVTDLLFFRARGGERAEVDAADRFILDGHYFEEFPSHILGTETGKDTGEDDQTKKSRWGYQVEGTFEQLPDLIERPMCSSCSILLPTTSSPKPSLVKRLEAATEGLPPEIASAVALGFRVDRYLATLSAEASDEPFQLWPELTEALSAWTRTHGNPWSHTDLRQYQKSGNTSLDRFLAAFTKTGALIPGLSEKPSYTPRYTGKIGDIVEHAEFLYRTHHILSVSSLVVAQQSLQGSHKLGKATDPISRLPELLDAGWCLDDVAWEKSLPSGKLSPTWMLIPERDYFTGPLWPKIDRLEALISRHAHVALHTKLWNSIPLERLQAQHRRLLDILQPAVFDDLTGVSPRQGWIPLHFVSEWLSESLNRSYGKVELERREGLVQLRDERYEDLDRADLAAEVRWCIGWINHDKTTFHPKKRQSENIDEVRLAIAAQWEKSFRDWIVAEETRKAEVEASYNRHFKGYIAPTYSAEPLPIARWANDGVRLHPHQISGARRVLANRGGLIAFDVGVGKTYTGIALLARARQEGWCRRPVILVPNSIVWKWEADIRRVLPNYRVTVIGSKKKIIARGERKGLETSDTDTPQERAEKWTRFQAGESDVVLLTYTTLARTRMNETALRKYAENTEAIRREVRLRQRNASETKKLTERQQAILKEGVSAWIAEQMELPEGWEYDPGIAWDDIGIDLLIVDEAQNFKNLYLPEPREGGVPRFMGNAGDGSKRAWQLDFRCAAVRQKTGGSGIVLLSATPAKNSPLEFYNLLQYIDHHAWSRLGIRDPEQFIDRYLKIALQPVVDSRMDVVERSAVVGFQNLHELRDVIFRYGEFKTAEDVGLKLPEPKVSVVEVDMNPAQEAKYRDYVAQIEAALESKRVSDKGMILGLLARMALVAVHPDLDAGYDWKSAAKSGVEPSSPKFIAMTKRILLNRSCGHIVFVDNVAAHRWIVQTMVKAGIPEARIAVLNAEVAPGAADRQRIAREFNGDADEGLLPKYDVVIANAIAYEGIDLQTRTCAIHHLDLPWEPATLQQRNGRGVRQGNKLANIEIFYYFSKRSQDGLRFNLIQGKLGWMTELLKSQSRDTNNPGAQMTLGPEEVLLLISRDPEKTAQRLAEVRARREAEARRKIAEDAGRLLRSANARFRRAERIDDPTEAARLRFEGEQRMSDLANVDSIAWPWVKIAFVVRETNVLVPPMGGCPVFEGLRVGIPTSWDPTKIDRFEFGRVNELSIGIREAGSAQWVDRSLEQIIKLGIRPEHLDPVWPQENIDFSRVLESLQVGEWPNLGWSLASDTWILKMWEQHRSAIQEHLAAIPSWKVTRQFIPAKIGRTFQIVRGAVVGQVALLPPTTAGWQQFQSMAPASGLKFTELDSASQYWWGRRLPKDLLSPREKAA